VGVAVVVRADVMLVAQRVITHSAEVAQRIARIVAASETAPKPRQK